MSKFASWVICDISWYYHGARICPLENRLQRQKKTQKLFIHSRTVSDFNTRLNLQYELQDALCSTKVFIPIHTTMSMQYEEETAVILTESFGTARWIILKQLKKGGWCHGIFGLI